MRVKNYGYGGIAGAPIQPKDMYELMAQKIEEQQAHRGLSISDVERLAKAGVAIQFSEIANRIVSDPPPSPPANLFPAEDNWTEVLLERYRRNLRARSKSYESVMYPFRFFATEHGDKVHVYVAPTDGRDPVVLVDDKAIFPSDALMSSIYLMEKCK